MAGSGEHSGWQWRTQWLAVEITVAGSGDYSGWQWRLQWLAVEITVAGSEEQNTMEWVTGENAMNGG